MDTEKLKALALAAQKGGDIFTMWDRLCVFQAEANPATVLELIAEDERKANRIAELEAEVEKLRARFEYIEDHATTSGGGNGFTVSFFVPVDCEDIGCGIDAAIEKEKA